MSDSTPYYILATGQNEEEVDKSKRTKLEEGLLTAA
jgi:hypothetical protein